MENTNIRDEIHKRVEEFKATLTPEESRLHEEALIKIFVDKKPIYEAVGISKESLEYLYSHAYSLYNAAKYEEAKNIFFMLNFLDPKDLRFPYSIAACYHMTKKYASALALYLECLLKDTYNPLLCWHLADCYNQLGKKVSALLMLKMCIRFASKDPAFQPLKTRAEHELAFIERELDEELKKEPATTKNE